MFDDVASIEQNGAAAHLMAGRSVDRVLSSASPIEKGIQHDAEGMEEQISESRAKPRNPLG